MRTSVRACERACMRACVYVCVCVCVCMRARACVCGKSIYMSIYVYVYDREEWGRREAEVGGKHMSRITTNAIAVLHVACDKICSVYHFRLCL